MKKIAAVIAGCLAVIGSATAQVTVEVTTEQDQFLPGESLDVAVRIINRSGQTLHLGADSAWLTFSVESRNGLVVSKKGEVPVQGEFTLDSSKRATKRVNLAPYFGLSTPGRYTITATLRVADWNQQIVSPAKGFDIIAGSKLWEQVVGLPKIAAVSNQPPELRRYILHQANYLKQLMLYVQVTDADGKVYRVFPLGPMLSFGQPEPQVDKTSNLHVLYQDGPRTFSYSVVDPDGMLIVRRTYDYTSRPRLKATEDGGFEVVGGTRRLTPKDIPAPAISDRSAAPPAP